MTDSQSTQIDYCSTRQLRELLGLGASRAGDRPDWLILLGDLDRLDLMLTEMCRGTEHSGKAVLDIACSPDTPVDVLVAVKNMSKRLLESAHDDSHRSAATFLYHLSIASALAHHSQVISTHDPAERLPLYEELATEVSDERLAKVFELAVERVLSGGSSAY